MFGQMEIYVNYKSDSDWIMKENVNSYSDSSTIYGFEIRFGFYTLIDKYYN